VQSYEVGAAAGGIYYGGAAGSPAVSSGPAHPGQSSGPPYDDRAAAYDAAGYPPAADPEQPGNPVAGPPLQPAPRQHSLLLPLFILTVIMLVLVSGALVAFVIRTGDGRGDGKGDRAAAAPASPSPPSPAPSASPSAAVDPCVVGTWSVTSASGPRDGAVFTTTSGGTYRLQADGTGEIDFGSGVTYTGTVRGKKAELIETGKILVAYTTVGQAINFRATGGDVRVLYVVGGVVMQNAQIALDTSAHRYTCSGNVLTLETDGAGSETLRRR
jgi:hypothetical protein